MFSGLFCFQEASQASFQGELANNNKDPNKQTNKYMLISWGKRISEETAFLYEYKEKPHPSGWLDSVNQRAKFLLLSVGRPTWASGVSCQRTISLASLSPCLSLSLSVSLSVSANQLIKSNGIDKNGRPWTVILELVHGLGFIPFHWQTLWLEMLNNGFNTH
jgi:hypothetical protein